MVKLLFLNSVGLTYFAKFNLFSDCSFYGVWATVKNACNYNKLH